MDGIGDEDVTVTFPEEMHREDVIRRMAEIAKEIREKHQLEGERIARKAEERYFRARKTKV